MKLFPQIQSCSGVPFIVAFLALQALETQINGVTAKDIMIPNREQDLGDAWDLLISGHLIADTVHYRKIALSGKEVLEVRENELVPNTVHLAIQSFRSNWRMIAVAFR